jgi:hypothetical protein
MMQLEICPMCHRAFPPRFDMITGRVRRHVVEVIAAHPEGIGMFDLIRAVYEHSPPATANASLSVMISLARRQLEPFGYSIRTVGKTSGAFYRLVAIAQP